MKNLIRNGLPKCSGLQSKVEKKLFSHDSESTTLHVGERMSIEIKKILSLMVEIDCVARDLSELLNINSKGFCVQ